MDGIERFLLLVVVLLVCIVALAGLILWVLWDDRKSGLRK